MNSKHLIFILSLMTVSFTVIIGIMLAFNDTNSQSPVFKNQKSSSRNKPIIVKKNIGGTEVQTTEAKLAEEKAADDEYEMRKTKRRGRRQTILTSQRGASGNLILGKPSLLGA